MARLCMTLRCSVFHWAVICSARRLAAAAAAAVGAAYLSYPMSTCIFRSPSSGGLLCEHRNRWWRRDGQVFKNYHFAGIDIIIERQVGMPWRLTVAFRSESNRRDVLVDAAVFGPLAGSLRNVEFVSILQRRSPQLAALRKGIHCTH